MTTWIAFLRAVNVGKRPFPMAELRQLLDQTGYADIATHIQTGNVRFESPIRSHRRMAEALETLFAADRGFEVPTVVFRTHELREIAEQADEVEAGDQPEFGHYVELLRTAPTAEDASLIEAQRHPGQRAVVRGRAVHLLFDIPYHQARGPSAAVRDAIGVSTNRNLKVVRALADKWC